MAASPGDPRSPARRIADELRVRIERGDLPHGAQLPTTRELMDRYGVASATANQVFAQLKAAGLVTTRPGSGTFVRAPRTLVTREPQARYQWEKDRVKLPKQERLKTGSTEYDTGLKVHNLEFPAEYDIIPAPADIAVTFGVSEGTPLLQRTYRTHERGEDSPITFIRSYLVHEMVAVNPDLLDASNEPWPGGTQHQLSTIGIELDKIVDRITARPPLPEEAQILDLGPGVSVLVLRKVSYDTAGRVVELSDVLFAGDRTEMVYTIQLDRWSS